MVPKHPPQGNRWLGSPTKCGRLGAIFFKILAVKHSEFSIGTRFRNVVGIWICTDVGTRTIAAIRLPDDTEEERMGATLEQWLQGPPYVLEERLFNEKDLRLVYQDWEAMILERSGNRHPGYRAEDMRRLMKDGADRLKHRALLAHDRLRGHELLHPYGLKSNGNDSQVEVFEPFTRTWSALPVIEFLALPAATGADIDRLADHHGLPARHPNPTPPKDPS